jgi:subtilisin family serine protease
MTLLRAGSTPADPARRVLLALIAAAVCSAVPGVAAAAPASVPGEVVVGFEHGATGSERAAARRDAGVTTERGSRLDGVQLVKVASGESTEDAIARLERDPNVKFAQPNRWRTAAATVPDDPLFGQLWGLNTIQAPQAWDVFKGVDTLVAVVDEGIEYDHPDLAANIWINPGESNGIPGADDDGNGIVDDIHGADFAPDGPSLPDGDPRDIGGHGTHVAGTIAARGNNGLGVTGVNWQARLMAVRVLSPSGGSDLAIAEGFDYAADEGARVVNASLGGPGSSPVMHDAMARHPNTLFVVAAGNEANNNDVNATSPCTENNANLICVAATSPSEGLASFSNFGATTVDIGAPGTIVLSGGLGRTRLSDGFEGSDFTSRWNPHSNTAVTWATANPGAASGTSITDSPAGNYANSVASYADLLTPLNLTGASGCVLHFTAKIALGPGDTFRVDRSINGGAFALLATFPSTGGVYRSREVALSANNQSNVVFGFGLESDSSGTADGVNVDDVSVVCAQSPTGNEAYVFLDGTSMASPHVAGAATLLLGSKPSLTTAELKTALLSTGDPQPALAGKTVTGRRLNLDKALRSVTPVSTPTPTPTSTPTPTATPTTTATPTPTGGTTPAPPTSVTQQTARLGVAEIARQARVTCARARGRFRCRVTRTSRTVRVRLVLKRRGRFVARASGLSSRRIRLRGGKPKPGRYTITLTVLENDAKATSIKRIRIR